MKLVRTRRVVLVAVSVFVMCSTVNGGAYRSIDVDADAKVSSYGCFCNVIPPWPGCEELMANENFGGCDTIAVHGCPEIRAIYLRFVIPADINEVAGARLRMYRVAGGASAVDVYGLNNGIQENWAEGTQCGDGGSGPDGITFNEAPGNDAFKPLCTYDAYAWEPDMNEVTLLCDQAAINGGGVGSEITIDLGQAGVDFINADTNRKVTFILYCSSGMDATLKCASKEDAQGRGPRLEVGVKDIHVDGVDGNDLNMGGTRETAFATIQKGIDEANDGDTVWVWPALYNESIYFDNKAIAVRSAADAAVLEATGLYAASFYTAEEQTTVLRNFVIRNSDTGILVSTGSPLIRNITLANNNLGIDADSGADPCISHCIFWDNGTDLWDCTAEYSYSGGDMNGPVAHWMLDEGAGDTAYDSAGTNDGNIHGAAWVPGILGGALDFNGISDSVECGTGLNTENITITVWIRPEAVPDYVNAGMVYKRNSYQFNMHPTGSLLFGIWGDKLFSSYDFSTHLSEWHHIAVTFEKAGTDQGDAKIYVDGALDIFGALAEDIDPGTWPVRIGLKTDDGTYFNGAIDDVRIYGEALSANEIEQIYEAGLSGLVYGAPLFADASNGDYHLKSERGRYWPAYDVWVLDSVTSPCVDGGDPYLAPSGERMPNGGRINMGAYGDTNYASMSEMEIEGDLNGDGVFNFEDLAELLDGWMEMEEWY